MLAPAPVALLCAIILSLPLAVFFTLTTPASTASSADATSSLLPVTTTTSSSSSPDISENSLEPASLLPPSTEKTPLEPHIKKQPTLDNPPPPAPVVRPSEEEEDYDDGPLLELASRVDPKPRPPVKKVAFMFLTTSPLAFAPLWELFFARAPKNMYNIYVHADPNSNYTTPFDGVFARRVVPSRPTRRHSPTLISAARRLIARALIHDGSNAMFALLSPSCIPIHSFRYTYRYLMRSSRSFIEILRDEPGAYDRWAARGEGAMLPEVPFEEFRIGSQFWVVKRKHGRIIVRDRKVWSKFRQPCLRDDTCYPEEHYFPTLLHMMDPRGCIPCTLTHVDWKGSHGGHPRMYNGSEVGPELIRALRKRRPRYGYEKREGRNSTRRDDQLLFARKFSPGSLNRLMSIASEVIFKD